jgi:hypothetical protein
MYGLPLPYFTPFMCCRWDRVPYLTTFLNGTASPWALYNEIRGNFFVAGGGANGGAVGM